MNLPRYSGAALALSLSILGSQAALATSFGGHFTQDEDVQFFSFTLGSPGHVTLSTASYTSGGFLPFVYLWDSTGMSLGGYEPGYTAGSIGDVNWDVDLSYPSAVGSYYVALSVGTNRPTVADLPAGTPTASIFQYFGQGNFTGLVATTGWCTTDHTDGFYAPGSTDCVKRNDAWALDITGAASASLYPAAPVGGVPEPASLALALAGLAGFAPATRRPARQGCPIQ